MIIGICGGSVISREKVRNIVGNYSDRKGEKTEFLNFKNGEELQIYEGKPPELLFLEVELEPENGILLAEKVNQRWPGCKVVYLADDFRYATEVYETEHLYFVLKERLEEKIEAVFRAFQRKQREYLVFSVVHGGECVLLPREILYFERRLRLTVLVSEEESYIIRETMDEVLGKLPAQGFLRCHNSYIVNLSAVKKFFKNAFLMKNDSRIMISRSYRTAVKAAFMEWGDRGVNIKCQAGDLRMRSSVFY